MTEPDFTDNLEKARYAIRHAHPGAAEAWCLLDIAESLRKQVEPPPLTIAVCPTCLNVSDDTGPPPGGTPLCTCKTTGSGFCEIHGSECRAANEAFRARPDGMTHP